MFNFIKNLFKSKKAKEFSLWLDIYMALKLRGLQTGIATYSYYAKRWKERMPEHSGLFYEKSNGEKLLFLD